MKVIHLEQNTQEWLDYRKDKFSASVTPVLFGVGYHKAYQEAYYRYGGGKRSDFDNIAMQNGREYEPKIRHLVNKELKCKFKPLVCEYELDTRFIASLDGYCDGVVLEIKVSDINYKSYKKTKKVPQQYVLQIQHQLFVTGAKKGLLALGYFDYRGNAYYELIEILPDEELQGQIKNKWIEFDNTYKNKKIDYKALENTDKLYQIRQQIKELQTQEEELESYFKQRENDEVFEINNIRLTCYTRSHTHIDYKKIVERNNYEILESDRQTKQTKTIKITEKKEIV